MRDGFSLGCRAGLRRNLPRRPDKTLSEGTQLGEFILAEFVIPVGEVPHCLVEPLGLVIWVCADHAALDDLLEHLVTGFIEHWLLLRGSYLRKRTSCLSLGH
jgi:hypothetical protein